MLTEEQNAKFADLRILAREQLYLAVGKWHGKHKIQEQDIAIIPFCVAYIALEMTSGLKPKEKYQVYEQIDNLLAAYRAKNDEKLS